MQLSLISYLSFLIAFQLLFLGAFLITHKKGNRRNNALLGTLFLLISWNMADITLSVNNLVLGSGILQKLDDGFILLYGPLIYLYTQGVIYRDFKLVPSHLLHLLPYLLFTVSLMYTSNYVPGTSEEILQNDLPWQFYLGSGFLYAHLFIYLCLSYRTLQNYRKVIRNKFSQIEQINLEWLSLMLKIFGILSLVSLVHNFMALAKIESVFLITLVLLLLFIFYFAIKVILKALRQPEIFAGIGQEETVKYEGSNLTGEQVEAIRERLLEFIATEKPYLNPQMGLADLSEKLSVSSKHLSQVINQCFGKNFFDFINSYRIKEAQQIFRESGDDRLTVLEVMFEVGFNSKSSFNTAFKKETGQTPTEFRKTI